MLMTHGFDDMIMNGEKSSFSRMMLDILYIYIYYEIVHEAHKKENKVIDLTITQDCK